MRDLRNQCIIVTWAVQELRTDSHNVPKHQFHWQLEKQPTLMSLQQQCPAMVLLPLKLLVLSDCSFGTFSQCSYSSYYYYRPAGIRCNPLSSYTAENCTSNLEGDIRLQSGTTEYEGRLEVCYGGRWSSVCNVDISDASVACKQLGHSQYACKYLAEYCA